MHKLTIITLLTLLVNVLFGQNNENINFSKKYFDAETMIEYGDFQSAIKVYNELLTVDSGNANINFKIGFCYLNTSLEKNKAIYFLEKALDNISEEYNSENTKGKSAPLETYFFLAQAYHLDYQFDKSINILDTLKSKLIDNEGKFYNDIVLLIEKCENGKRLVQYPVKMKITNLGKIINSKFDEHSPVFSADEAVLIFTTKRDSTNSQIDVNGQYNEKIFISNNKGREHWSEPKSISNLINTEGNNATIGLSVDGQTLFIYRSINGNGDIYMSKLEGDEWSSPEKLPEPINTKYRETSASLSANGKTLYFTSNRKGGFGGVDIYRVNKLPNGVWGKAENLGPNINTEFNEESPFIHPDEVTLFYSSEGHNNMGGYDIFFSSIIENETTTTWSEPTNVGYPINTTSHDVFYIPTPDGKRAYYSSHQDGGIGGNDIYLISLDETDVRELTVMTGYITMSDGTLPKGVNITVTDIYKDEIVGLYSPNSKTGKYLFILKPGRTYNVLIEADNFLYHSENIKIEEGTSFQRIKRAIILDPIIFGKTKSVHYATFNNNDVGISEGLTKEISNLVNFLEANKDLNLEIVRDKNSGALGDSRYSTIRNLLIKEGVSESRISQSDNNELENGKLKLVIKTEDIPKTFRINFADSKSEVNSDITKEVVNLANFLEANKDLNLEIVTDNNSGAIGDSRYSTIRDLLIKEGISENRISQSHNKELEDGKVKLLIETEDNPNIYHINLADGKSGVNSDITKQIANLANYLKANKDLDLEIVTDNNSGAIGDSRYSTIRDLLIKEGISENRISQSHNKELEDGKVKVLIETKDIPKTLHINFADGKSGINSDLSNEIANLANYLKANKDLDLEIVRDKNSGALGDSRYSTIRNLLIKEGISESRISQSNNKELENGELKLVIANKNQRDIYNQLISEAELAFKNGSYQQARELYNKALGILTDEQYPKDRIALIDSLIAEATNNNNLNIDGEVVISYVLFPFDKDKTNEYNSTLDKLAIYLKNNKEAVIEIQGHTDAQGSSAYNIILSTKRADFVKNYLVNKGANNSNLIIKAYGETNQIAINLNPKSRKYNRRVEFKLIKESSYQDIKFKKVIVPNNYIK